MNIQEAWEKALKGTEVIRPRVQPLDTFGTTTMPYIFLSESSRKAGNTTVRRGEIVVEKPSIVLPYGIPQFEGFEFEEAMDINEDILKSFFLVRGVSFPSLKYNNKSGSSEDYADKLHHAIEHYSNRLQREEDVHTGLIAGSEDVWQFSILIFICSQIAKSTDNDIRRIWEDYKRKGLMS